MSNTTADTSSLDSLFELVEEEPKVKQTKQKEATTPVIRKHFILLEYEETFEVPVEDGDQFNKILNSLKNKVNNEEYKWKHRTELRKVSSIRKEY